MDPPVERRKGRSSRGGNATDSRIVSRIPSRHSQDDFHGFIPNQHLHDSQTSQESWGPAVTATSGRRGGRVSSYIEVQHMSLGDEGSNSCSSTSQLSSRAGSQRGSYNANSLSNHLRGGNVSSKRQLKGRMRSDYSLGDDSDNSVYMIGNRGSGGRRQRGDQYSEDGSTSQSYDNLLDESSRRGSGGGGWSLSKSVFSTLPDRLRRGRLERSRDDDGSMYDGDDGSVYSLSSRGTNHSYGLARRVPSRSSSIASRMSQSSGGSGGDQSGRSQQSPRAERFNLPPPGGEGPYDCDSDGSMGSLLGEIDHEPAELNNGSAIGESLPATISVFSGSFLLDTNTVGTGADAKEDDLRVSTISIGNFGLEDEIPIPVGGKGCEDPWWIEDLEKEGWFEYDTSTVRLDEPVPKLKPKEGSLHEDSDHGEDGMPPEGNLEEEYEASQPIETSDGIDDTSTVGVEDGHLGNWEERLWSAAREHYSEYIGIDDMASSFAGSSLISGGNVSIDEQTVLEQEQQFELEYEREQKGVFAFRALLMKCIQVHVNAFHAKPDRMSSKSKSDAISLGVDHYVPVPTARALYSEVIKMVDKEGGNNLAANTSIEKRADVITTILTNDKVGIFRRYQVTTVNELTLTATRDAKRSRKRLNKGVKSFDAHAELEQYLYGEMFEADDGEDTEQETVLETTEHEVRIRTKVVNSIFAKCGEADMGVAQQIAANVLHSTVSLLEEANVEKSREEGNHHQPIVHLYALRYIPVFLMRALIFVDVPALTNGPTAINVTFEVLFSLLLKKSYVMKRYELQGPYDATLTHLSNFESAFGFHSEILREQRDDDEEYSAMHKVLVSTLISHRDSILINTCYQREIDEGQEGEHSNVKKEEAGGETIITVYNYATIVATCLEIGRSLHHLGLCLGRRQRDRTATSPEDQSEKVDMEVKAYRNAFEAYKAALLILNKAEENASHSVNSRRISSNADSPQERESRSIGSRNELQQIRDARISIELHLADTLNCLGFCHDSKLGEFDRALLAYKESLSLYIKHVGRFHQTVSNALHNMGSIHCELGEWKQASSCFRQSLSILKREDKKTKQERDQCNAEQGMHCPQILTTLQCLGNALANLKEFEASAACFREVLESDLLVGFANSDSFVAEIESQMANVYYERAVELSRTFNWRCHVMLFSEHKTRHGDRPPDAILAEEFETLREAQGCIQKAIETKRHLCYKVTKNPSDEAIFFGNSPDPSPWLGDFLGETLLAVSDDTSLETLTIFAKDLLIAGRLDLRLRAYDSALSYIFEALVINLLLHSKTTDAHIDKLRNYFRFQHGDKGLGPARLQVPEDASEIIWLLDDLEIAPDRTEVVAQVATPLFLLGSICFRLQDLCRAKALFKKTLDLLNSLPEDGDLVPKNAKMTARVDVGHLLVRLGVIDLKVGDAELALSRFEEAMSRFQPKSIIADGSNEDDKGLLSIESQIAINQGMALSRWYIGKIYQGQENKSHTALKYFKDAIQSLNENHVLRMDYGVDSLPALIESYCLCDDIPIISTAIVLSSSNEQCGILLGSTNSFSLSCFEQAVGVREFVISSVGPVISSIDNEASIEYFILSAWDSSNMDCYRRMLRLIDKKASGAHIVENEVKGWKFTGLDDDNESALTREDILFRMGNLQVKLGQLRPAIDSYREAEDLTVDKLGTRDHPIVMSINHNLGNAYKSVWLMSGTRTDSSGKEEAIACYQESVRISQAFYGKHHSSAAESLIGLGQLYMRNDELWLDIQTEEDSNASEDNHLAYKFYREALSIRKREKGGNGSQAQQEVGSILCSLGVLRLRRYEHRRNEAELTGTLDEAVGLLAEGLKASKFGGQYTLHCRNCYFGLGKAHLARAIAYKDDEEKMNSELTKSFKAFETGVDIERSVASKMSSGNDCLSPNLFEACCLFYMGQVCHRRCEHDKTRENLQSALRIFRSEGRKRLDQLKQASDEVQPEDTYASGRIVKELEVIHLWAAKVLHQLGESHKEMGSYSDSIECCVESLKIRRTQSPGVNRLSNAATLTILAGSYFEAENYDRSVEYYARCLRIYLNRYGKESPEVAQILIFMGRSFSANELYVKAFQCFDKAMRIYDYGADELALSTREKKSLLHRELASIVKHVNGDIFEALEHYRSSVSYLEEHIERRRAMQRHMKGKREFDQQLMAHYQEMLSILREVHAGERDRDKRADFQEEICDVLHRLGNLYASRAEYDAALECFNEVLESKRMTSQDLRVADLLFNIGNIYLELCLPQLSLESLMESYDITKKALGEESTELHSTFFLTGVAFIRLNNIDSARDWLTRALDSLAPKDSEGLPVDEEGRGKTLYYLGVVYERMGDAAKALFTYDQAIRILMTVQSNGVELANALDKKGNLCVSDFEPALECYNQSLNIRAELGDEVMVANTKNNIGVTLCAMNDLERAMPFISESLRVRTKCLGKDSVETANSLVDAGQIYLGRKQYTVASKFFIEGLRILKSRLESDHPDIATCMYKIGVSKEALMDENGALQCYRQSIEIFKRGNVPEKNVNIAYSLHSAALIHHRRGDNMKALEMMGEALEIKNRILAYDHPDTSDSHYWLAYIHLELNDTDGSLSHFKNALKIRVSTDGTENQNVSDTLYGLAQVHFKRDEFKESMDCLVENLRVLMKIESTDVHKASSELLLGSCFQELGDFETAIDHLTAALDLLTASSCDDNLDSAQALFRLGICYCEIDNYDASIEKFEKCLEVRRAHLGKLHFDCANTYESIGIVQQKRDRHEEAIHSFERALAIKKACMEDCDEDFCVLLHFVGSSKYALGRYADAIHYFNDSVARKARHYGRQDEDYAMSVIDQAAAYAKSGDESRSVECYRQAIDSGGLPSDSWQLGIAHQALGSFYFDSGMNASSAESYKEAVSIFEWVIEAASSQDVNYDNLIQCYIKLLNLDEDDDVGPITEHRATLCYKIANSFVQVGKHADAIVNYREAIMIQTQLYGTGHLSVANSLHNLGNCYRDLSEFEKSAECLAKALSIATSNFEEDNEEIADTCHCLAITLMTTCEFDEATSLFERALAVRKKRLGALDLSIASTLHYLATLLRTIGQYSSALKNAKEALKVKRMTIGDDSPITLETLEVIALIHKDNREFEDAIEALNDCLGLNPLLHLDIGILMNIRGEHGKARTHLMKAKECVSQRLDLSQSKPLDEISDLTLSLQEKKRGLDEKDLLGYAKDLMTLSSVYLYLGQHTRSLECLRFSNPIIQSKCGSDHLSMAENLHLTGFILEKMSESVDEDSSGNLDEGLELLTEALRIRKIHLDESHPDLEETLLCVGKVHRKVGNIRDALVCMAEAAKARDTRLGRKHAHIDDANALLELGQLQQESGDFRQALDSFEECLEMKRSIQGSDHPMVGELLFYIGNLLREVGDLDLAQIKFEESLAIAERVDPEGIEAADILFGLGVLHTEQKKFDLALDAYMQSLQIHKLRGSTLLTIADLLNNIGISYYYQQEFDRAQVYHAEALESLKQELEGENPDLAYCYHSLGNVHMKLNEYSEALTCFESAVAIDRNALYLQNLGICLVKMENNEDGYVCLQEALRMKELDVDIEHDDDVAEISRHLGIIWARKKKYDDALICFEKALKIKLQIENDSEKEHQETVLSCLDGALEAVADVYGSQHIKYARLLHKKGNVHGAMRDHSLAIEAYVEALRIYKEEHGDGHLSVANTLFNLGVSLNAKNSPEKSIRCLIKSLRITKARLGDEHLDVADTFEQLAESYKLLSKPDEATNYYEQALKVRKQSNGVDLKCAGIMHEMGQIQSQEGLWENAERAFRESVRIRTIHLGQDDSLVADSMHRLGLVYKHCRDYPKALKYLEGSLRICKSKLGSSDPQIADIFHSLGEVHAALENVEKSIFCYDKSIKINTDIHGGNHDRVALAFAGKGKALQLAGQLEPALEALMGSADIMKVNKDFAGREESGDVLAQMGSIYSQLGDALSASSSFASALTTYKELFGARHAVVADVLQLMADHFVKYKEFERGYSCVKEALALRENLLGEKEIASADSHYCMGEILFVWSENYDAMNSFEKCREIYRMKLGDSVLPVANSDHYLGCISERNGDYDSAAQYLQDALVGRKRHLHEHDSDIALTLSRLGHVYFKKAEYNLAATTFSECLKIREINRGTDVDSQIEVADTLFDLGQSLQCTLDTQRSMQLFSDALKEYKRHLETQSDIRIAKCHSCLGEIYEKENQLPRSVKELLKATHIYESQLGSDPPEKTIKASKGTDDYAGLAETLFRLATAQDRLGEEVTALKLYRRSMKLYKTLFGRDSLDVAKILNRLANMKGRGGSVDKAMILFDESLRIRMLHLGSNNEEVAETLFGMGIVFEKRRDYGAAMKAYSDCLRIRSSKFGSDSMEVAQVVVNIGVVRGNKGDFEGALKSWNKALSIYRKNGLENDDTLVSTVLSHMQLANELKNKTSR